MKEIKKNHRLKLKLRSLLIPDGANGDRSRGRLYEPYLKAFGENFKVGSQAFIYNPNGLIVGNHVYVGFNSYLGQGDIILEDEVLIGNFVSITASNHLIKGDSFRFGGYDAKTVKIGRGTWLGAHSSITAGVEIGKSCLVAAGAVVTKSFDDGKIIGGVPAREIGKVDSYREKYNEENK